MNGNTAMVESLSPSVPGVDCNYDFERAMRLEEMADDMLKALKHLLQVVGQPLTAETKGSHIQMQFCTDDINHLLRNSRAIVQHIEMGDPI